MPAPNYTIDELVGGAPGFFGIDAADVKGAFYGRSGTYTLSAATAILNAWLGTPVPGPGGPGPGPGARKVAIVSDVAVGPEGTVPISRSGAVVWEAGGSGGGGTVLHTTTAQSDPLASSYADGTLWVRTEASP